MGRNLKKITSILITLVLLYCGLGCDVRKTAEYKAIKEERDKLKEERDTAVEELESSRKENENLKARCKALQQKLDGLNEQPVVNSAVMTWDELTKGLSFREAQEKTDSDGQRYLAFKLFMEKHHF